MRPPCVLHCTSEPIELFGRQEELSLLDAAVRGHGPSVLGLIGPGGQGKTAIVQTWLRRLSMPVDGLFFWSFYRGKDADLCLRRWLAYADGRDDLPDVSAAFAAERLVNVLRRERWAVVLDGAEVAQHEEGEWHGRFIHPDLGALLIELASAPTPGVVALTSRFPMPELARRPFHRSIALDRLDRPAARALLTRLGIAGGEAGLDAVADAAGRHAKAVELMGTLLARYHGGRADASVLEAEAADDVEAAVAGVLTAFAKHLSDEQRDLIALATAFRDPPTEPLLLEYLASDPVRALLRDKWDRHYPPFGERGPGWLTDQVEELVRLRLLERVGPGDTPVIDAHPLVRRGFERGQTALARAGFLRGRPDRRRAASLEEARPHVELFHAHCDAGLFNEADGAFVALEGPKWRFLAPALERDLLRRFFPNGDYHRPPLWPGFGRWRALAISLEMLGQYEDALAVYRPADAALRGDALLALGRPGEIVAVPHVAAPWQGLWQAYRAHALCLVGRVEQAVAIARALVPVDAYEWVHVVECLLRAGRLETVDERSLPRAGDHRWADLACRRIRADLRRVREPAADLASEYAALVEEYDRAGLPLERALTRLSLASWWRARGESARAERPLDEALTLIESFGLGGLAVDAWAMKGDSDRERHWRDRTGIRGPVRG